MIGLAACREEESSGKSSEDEDSNLKIGISLPSATHGWMGALIQNAEDQAKELKESEGIEYVMTKCS